jgi:hypothetical protein
LCADIGFIATALPASQAGSIAQEVFRNAIIKSYELTQETSFEYLKKASREYGHSGQKLEAMFAKDVLRLAAVHDLRTRKLAMTGCFLSRKMVVASESAGVAKWQSVSLLH